jgi:hypothetical protein
MTAFQVLRAILAIGMICLFIAPLVSGLKTGGVRGRAGPIIHRKRNPVLYWLMMLVGSAFVALLLYMLVWNVLLNHI